MDWFNILFYAVAAIIVFVIIFLIVKDARKQPTASAPTGATASTPTSTGSNAITSATGLNYALPLRRGVSGAEVQELQRKLNAFTVVTPKLTVDGRFGALTENALMQAKGVLQTTLAEFVPYALANTYTATGTGGSIANAASNATDTNTSWWNFSNWFNTPTALA